MFFTLNTQSYHKHYKIHWRHGNAFVLAFIFLLCSFFSLPLVSVARSAKPHAPPKPPRPPSPPPLQDDAFIFDGGLSYSSNETYVFNYGNYYNYDTSNQEQVDYESSPVISGERDQETSAALAAVVNAGDAAILGKVGDNYSNLNNLSHPHTYCEKSVCHDGIFKWHESKTKKLYVGGIFPMVGGWPGGQACLPSAIMALNEVNLNADVLPAYRLELNWFNSECDPGKGVSNLYEMIFHKNQNQDDIIMLLGPGCSDVSSSVAEVANHWNLTVVNRKRIQNHSDSNSCA